MMRTAAAGVLLLALILPACESTTEPTTIAAIEEAAVEAIAESHGLVEEAGTRGGPGPALFDRLAAGIPRFAGLYFLRCDVVVVLTDGDAAPAASGLLDRLLQRYLNTRARACHGEGSVVVQAGDYTWTELSGYLPALRPLQQLRGVGRMGISIPENRIIVQLRAAALVAEVKAQAAALGVPPDALAVVVIPRGRFAAADY